MTGVYPRLLRYTRFPGLNPTGNAADESRTTPGGGDASTVHVGILRPGNRTISINIPITAVGRMKPIGPLPNTANPIKPKETLETLNQYKPLVTYDNLTELRKIRKYAPQAGLALRQLLAWYAHVSAGVGAASTESIEMESLDPEMVEQLRNLGYVQ